LSPCTPFDYGGAMRGWFWCLAVSSFLVASGCAPAPPAPQTPPPPAEAAPSAAPTASPEVAPKPSAPGKTLDEHRGEFLSGCTGKLAGADAYCACSWQQMSELFTLDDLNNGHAKGDPRYVELKTRVRKVCLDKLPEPTLRAQYVAACVGGDATVNGYCQCTYAELHKRVPVEAIMDADVLKTERFLTERKAVVKACSAKLPEEVVHAGFVKGCATSDALQPFCACAWKAARSVASAAEIEASLFDEAALRAKMQKSCANLLPAKP
jgi:hypothetical protein